MQNTNVPSNFQNGNMPSLTLLEEAIQVRLEQFAFSAHISAEHYQQNPQSNHTIDTTLQQLELTLLELSYAVNDLRWLQWLKNEVGE